MGERTVELVGRERELAAIERLFTDVEAGLSAMLIEGEPGIGKTAVFNEALDLAAARGFHVLSCRARAAEATLSLASVSDLVEGFPTELWDVLPAPQRRALDVTLLRVEPGDVPVNQRAVAAAVRSLVVALAAQQPVLLAVDDVQWLDDASAIVLTFVLRRLGPERVALLATRRLSEAVQLDLDALTPATPIAREQLGPLSLGALRHTLKDHLGLSLPRSTLVRLHSTSHGNPLFALEIGRVLAQRGTTDGDEPLPVPSDTLELVRARVAELPDATRELLLAAAMLAEPTLEVLERVLGRPPHADITPAERIGVAVLEGSSLSFAHPLHAAAVVAIAAAADRRVMHQRLADVLHEPEERARHLALGSEEPDENIANLVEQGAAAARARGALHAAAELFERARSLTPAGQSGASHARGLRAAELYFHGGDRSLARALLEELLAEPLAASDRAEALRLLAELSYSEEDLPESERLLIESLGAEDDPERAARTQLDLVYVICAHRMDFNAAADLAQHALENLRGSADAALVAEALAYSAMVDFLSARAVRWDKIEQALALEDPDRMPLLGLPPLAVAGLLLAYVGRHAEARDTLAAARQRLAERGEETDLVQVLLWLSWLETRCGDFVVAEAHADEAMVCAAQTGDASHYRWAIAQRALVHAHRGDPEAVRKGCAAAIPSDDRGVAHVGRWLAAAPAVLELSLGDPEAAWAACQPMTDAVEQMGVAEPILAFFLPDAIEALIGTGQLDRAERLVAMFEERGRALDRIWALATGARCRGLLLAARGDAIGAGAAFDDALAQHERIDLPFDRARTLLAKGSTERRARRRADARRSLEEARSEFERMGATLWAARARDESDRLGGRRAGPAGALTPSERRVVELAAEGLSNKHIAGRLNVSVHTVEVHLSHAYEKLGVRSRSQLTARLVGGE